MMDNARTSAINALWQGALTSLVHWRVLLLWWLAGLVPAFWLSRQVANAAHAILAHHPEAGRIIAEPDLAALADAWLANNEVIAQLTLDVLPPLLLTALLAPWTAGIAVTSLRAATPLGFAALCRGGLREYAPQLRLYLLFSLPLLTTLILFFITQSILEAFTNSAVVYSDIEAWHTVSLTLCTFLFFSILGSLQAARAAFAAEPPLRSAFLASSRGWQLVFKRSFSCSLILLSTLAASIGTTFVQQWLALQTTPVWLALGYAQLAVLIIAYLRFAKLCALQQLQIDMKKQRYAETVNKV